VAKASIVRFVSGDPCVRTGWYEFDGFVRGLQEPCPSLDEMEILVGSGEAFPMIRGSRRPCYWIPAASGESAARRGYEAVCETL
jgi:hypothetical protein